MIMQPNIRLVGGGFWDFFDHTLPLTEKGMAEALLVSGFEVLENRPRFLPYTTKSLLPRWSCLVRFYLTFPPVQWLFGKQMLLVARRPIDDGGPTRASRSGLHDAGLQRGGEYQVAPSPRSMSTSPSPNGS